jgi:Pretoxin HINT domain/Protein of unknown function (DUF3990)
LVPGGSRAIEELRVGDLVLSRDEFDVRGEVRAKVVEEVFERFSAVWELRAGGQVILTTGEHPFFRSGEWVAAKELQVGDKLTCQDGSMVTIEGLRQTDQWQPVYNLRIADYHTYFVGDDSWGWAVWAHNQYFYHATSDAAAQSILSSGVNLTFAKPRQDFGKAFYTTTSLEQAKDWATKRYPGHGVVLKYNVDTSELAALTILAFPGATPEWQETVWRGRRGILDQQPLNADLVTGPYLVNTGDMKESGTSAFDARGRGDQQAWMTAQAFTILQHHKPVFV